MSYLKDKIKKIKKSKTAVKLTGWAIYWYIRFVAATTRWQIRHIENFYDNLDRFGSVIFISWHGRIAFAPYFWDRRKVLKALVSPHQDGQIMVGILSRFGIGNISGSTNEHANSAALTLMREIKNGTTIAIIPDGPRGPSMTMTHSPLYYAQKTGKPIIGVTYSIEGSKVLEKSWDRMLLPPPFHKGIIDVTEPFFVPENANAAELENIRLKIENKMNNMMWALDEELGLPKIPQGTMPKKKRSENGKNNH